MKWYCTSLQENEDNRILGEDPAKDPNYSEPDIDNLRAHKDLVIY